MGSLMAGWDSSAHHDPKAASYKRNRSFTKGEIEAYWKSKKKTEEDHLRAISRSQSETLEATSKKGAAATFQRSSTFPITKRMQDLLKSEPLPGMEDLTKQSGWWTRSCWAFLNEPPVIPFDESTSYVCRQGINSRVTPHTIENPKPDAQAC
ncbi:uncharacterized protein LOC116247236 [Nymphaea colorata]|uniref:uncharacterized protein LOC116247236 n=1 Tax=Nymphaea colorata TaxID=210225 RepID=UPI00214DF5E4|nr:uncharacterized protein LOC116247236 [Nymphaea colorata]